MSNRYTFDQEMWLPRIYVTWENARCPSCGERENEGDPVWKDPDLEQQGDFPWVCRDCALLISNPPKRGFGKLP